jgi:hypothetical protein
LFGRGHQVAGQGRAAVYIIVATPLIFAQTRKLCDVIAAEMEEVVDLS